MNWHSISAARWIDIRLMFGTQKTPIRSLNIGMIHIPHLLCHSKGEGLWVFLSWGRLCNWYVLPQHVKLTDWWISFRKRNKTFSIQHDRHLLIATETLWMLFCTINGYGRAGKNNSHLLLWPHRSSDLTLSNFLLWNNIIKNNVYVLPLPQHIIDYCRYVHKTWEKLDYCTDVAVSWVPVRYIKKLRISLQNSHFLHVAAFVLLLCHWKVYRNFWNILYNVSFAITLQA